MTAARQRFAEFHDALQKRAGRRAIREITGKITSLLGAVGLWVSAVACGPSVVDLGTRGNVVAGSGMDGSVAMSGAGGAAGNGAAGLGPAGAGATAVSGTPAVGVAGSEPGTANDAGMTVLPDAGAPDAGPMPMPSTGCGLQPNSDSSIAVNGLTARYIVDPATDYDPNRPYPLVMSFRTANVTIEAFRRDFDLRSVVGADGIVVNVDCAGGAGRWDLQLDSLVFEALLAKLEASYCIDRRRVFVVGHETGAIFANVLACMHAGTLRGLGSLSGVEPMVACTGGLAVWISQGSGDVTLLMLGMDNRDFWLQQNQCDATMSIPVEPSPCLEYLDCEAGKPVRYCEYAGNQDVPSFAAAGVWDFFKGL